MCAHSPPPNRSIARCNLIGPTPVAMQGNATVRDILFEDIVLEQVCCLWCLLRVVLLAHNSCRGEPTVVEQLCATVLEAAPIPNPSAQVFLGLTIDCDYETGGTVHPNIGQPPPTAAPQPLPTAAPARRAAPSLSVADSTPPISCAGVLATGITFRNVSGTVVPKPPREQGQGQRGWLLSDSDPSMIVDAAGSFICLPSVRNVAPPPLGAAARCCEAPSLCIPVALPSAAA